MPTLHFNHPACYIFILYFASIDTLINHKPLVRLGDLDQCPVHKYGSTAIT